MFRLALVLLFVSLMTALVAFRVIPSSFGELANVLSPIFLILSMLAFLVAGVRGVLSAKL